MHPKNRKILASRVAKAGGAALKAQHYVSPLDVLVGMGWLPVSDVKRWRQGQVDYLERVVQANLSRISEAMKMFRSWATERGLRPSETHYATHTRRRQTLRFSKSGNPTIERLYRTHWVSKVLSERKRERLAAKAQSEPPSRPADRQPDSDELAPPHGFEPRSPHSKCGILPLDEGGTGAP